ncbi:MAG: SIMPL domain-containing protein [Nitratireductor sp.]|nr:SIMPL domain-containing protein [Nitratireductor sp.]
MIEFCNSAVAAVLAAGMLLIPAAAMAQLSAPAGPSMPVIRVTGEGTARIVPDTAILTLGVLRQAPTAREALDAHTQVMGQLGEALRGAGIKPEDMQTANFSITPQYVYPQPKANGEQDPPRIVGYQVSSQLVVRIRDVGTIGKVLDEAVSLGVNSDGGIQFTNDDPSAAVSEARADAMKDAIARATTLAESANAALGAILEISENSGSVRPMPMARGKAMMEAAAGPVPVEAGQNTYTVTVNVVFELKQWK